MLKAPKETIIRKVASPKTYYAIAAIWVLGTLVLPMYKLTSYLILAAVAVSTAEVESSSIRTFGFLIRARAMQRRCLCPPDTFVPPCSI